MALALLTKDSLTTMITAADDQLKIRIVGCALVVLFKRQTEAEKSANTTNEWNNVGFAHVDARSGTLTAKSFIKRGTLDRWQVEMWVKPTGKGGHPRIAKYWRQLNEAAEQKAAADKKTYEYNSTTSYVGMEDGMPAQVGIG